MTSMWMATLHTDDTQDTQDTDFLVITPCASTYNVQLPKPFFQLLLRRGSRPPGGAPVSPGAKMACAKMTVGTNVIHHQFVKIDSKSQKLSEC